MKKTKKTMLTAAILAAGLAGCQPPVPSDQQNVYGPPPDYEPPAAESSAEESLPSESIAEDGDSSVLISAESPAESEESSAPDESAYEDAEMEEFSETMIEVMYGPPEFFE